MDMGLNPGGEILREGGLRKGIIAGSKGSHKDLSLVDLSGLRIGDLHRLPGIINEEFFSGPAFLTKTEIQFLNPLLVVVKELLKD